MSGTTLPARRRDDAGTRMAVVRQRARPFGLRGFRATRQSPAVGVCRPWYYPHRLPLAYGFRYWGEVFKPTSDAFASLSTSVLIATITVVVCLLVAIPAG